MQTTFSPSSTAAAACQSLVVVVGKNLNKAAAHPHSWNKAAAAAHPHNLDKAAAAASQPHVIESKGFLYKCCSLSWFCSCPD